MRENQIFGIIGAVILAGTTILLLKRDNTKKYSNKWLASLPRDELEAEREKIRSMWCSVDGDFSLAVKLENLLRVFDNELRRRDWGDLSQEIYKYPPHREHGWNLYKDDD